jgi:hypothetical protein
MLIRFGYDITVSCAQDTPMITMMSVRDERLDDLRVQAPILTTPLVPTSAYRDMFGNTCRRFVAPAGEYYRVRRSARSDQALAARNPGGKPAE